MDIDKVLSDNRSSQANLGLLAKDFYKLLVHFDKELFDKKKQNGVKNLKNAGRKSILETSKKKLFYSLYYLKVYPTFDVLGATFGMDRGTACKWAHRYIDVLFAALVRADVIPKRKIKSRKEFIKCFPDLKMVITDGTERRKRRPKNQALQKEFYSGKKNATQ